MFRYYTCIFKNILVFLSESGLKDSQGYESGFGDPSYRFRLTCSWLRDTIRFIVKSTIIWTRRTRLASVWAGEPKTGFPYKCSLIFGFHYNIIP